jgi:hypothetical protein
MVNQFLAFLADCVAYSLAVACFYLWFMTFLGGGRAILLIDKYGEMIPNSRCGSWSSHCSDMALPPVSTASNRF